MRATRSITRAKILATGLVALALAGCAAGELLIAYTGGGLPPGEPDLGGIVVASVDGAMATAQDGPPAGTEVVAGAQVQIMRGRRVLGTVATGEGGYFRFERPDTGNYTLVATPPASRPDLRGAERAVAHVRDARTFVTIELPRAQGR